MHRPRDIALERDFSPKTLDFRHGRNGNSVLVSQYATRKFSDSVLGFFSVKHVFFFFCVLPPNRKTIINASD